MKRPNFGILAVVILVAALATASAIILIKSAQAQGDILSQLTDMLSQQGVPYKSVRQYSQIPFRIEVTVQSTSNNANATSDDLLFELLIQRDVALLQNRIGVHIDRIMVIILNAAGTSIYESEVPVRVAIVVQPSTLDNTSAAALVAGKLDLAGMTLDKLDVSSDTAGARILTIQLSLEDAGLAGGAIDQFIPKLYNLIDRTNSEQGAQFAVYKVIIVDSKLRLLLSYVRDVQLSQESWWHAEDVTTTFNPIVIPTPPPSAFPTKVGYPPPLPTKAAYP